MESETEKVSQCQNLMLANNTTKDKRNLVMNFIYKTRQKKGAYFLRRICQVGDDVRAMISHP